MNDNMLKQFRTLGRIQSAVSKAENLHDALHDSLHVVLDTCSADYAIVWNKDEIEGELLRPEYWISPVDVTSRSYRIGEGTVGRCYSENRAIRYLEYKKGTDPELEADLEGIDIGGVVCVPMGTENDDLGCIEFVHTSESGPISEVMADIFEMLTMMISINIADNEKLQKPWKMGEVILSARDIQKEFVNAEYTTKVLKGVNLDIYEGEFVAVLGESGCGKSTFLNIIGGMDKASAGSFSFKGEDMTNASQDELTRFRRDNIGFIFQSYNLMPNLTAKQNLDLIAELVDNPMDSEEALELVGLKDKKDNYPSQLSGGQQQRVSIARALIKNPAVVFADEPTAALDYATSIEVLEVLEKIVARGTTLVMVTHNEEITRMADRVIRMRRGKTYEVLINRHPAAARELVW